MGVYHEGYTMASKRNRGRIVTSAVNTSPTQTQETPLSNTPEIVEDNLTTKAPATAVISSIPTDETVSDSDAGVEQVEEDSIEEPVMEEEGEAELGSELAVETPLSEDDRLVTELKEKLATFKTLLEGYGDKPEDFAQAAKKGYDVAKFAIKYPKTPVLNTLLAFFVENKDGAASGIGIMKGATTLPANELRVVGVLFNLFSNLASHRFASIDNGYINGILKKPEIVNYYNRRKAGIKAAANG
jgi:hypothetical protein